MYMIKKRLTYVFKCFNEIIMGNNDIYIYTYPLEIQRFANWKITNC